MGAPDWAALAAAVLSRRDTPSQGVPLSRPYSVGQRDTWTKAADFCAFQVSHSDAEQSSRWDTPGTVPEAAEGSQAAPAASPSQAQHSVASPHCPTVPPPRSGTAGHLAETRRNLRPSGVPLGCVTIPEAGHLAGRGRDEVGPGAAPEPRPYLTRRVKALLAAGAEVRRDGTGVILTATDGSEMHLTPTGLRYLPPALVERLERMAGPP
jgi:hypothetical protein